MAIDPIIRQVRQIRHAIDRECQQDPERYYRLLQGWQQKLTGRLVRRQPRPLATARRKKTGVSTKRGHENQYSAFRRPLV